jgi:tRNA/rRNA methyltransferase
MNCRVVLVRPQIAGNVGAVARVMRNLGFFELVLVNPAADPTDCQARQLSAHGEDILDRCRVVASFAEAVADCGMVAATSARTGGLFRRQSVGTPEQVVPRLVEVMAATRVGLVFGPESTGLENAEITRCHCLIHIPTDPTYSALNLAQAAAICLYEVRQAWLRGRQAGPGVAAPAPFADQERMFASLRKALQEVHFLYGEKADTLMHGLRHLIGRAGPTPMEVELLFGLARQLRWFAAHHRLGPEAGGASGANVS